MKITLRLAPLSLLLFAGSVSRTARAADGRIPISAVPYTISAPGVYYLTQDLTVASGNAITISAGKVTLDLNGHTLTNNATASGSDVIYSSTAAGYGQVRITNGNLAGGFNGINIFNTAGGDYQVDHLAISGNVGNYALFLGSNTGAAPATHAVVDSVRVVNCGSGVGGGIYLQNVRGGRVTGSSVRSCSRGIALFQCHGLLLDGNSLVSNTNEGILLQNSGATVSRDNLITGNVILQNSGAGIALNTAHSNRINRNSISENGGGGISLVTSNLNEISGNTITVNTGDGIRLNTTSRNNSFDWNVVSGNTGWGLDFFDVGSTANIYSYNRFAGNTTGAVGGTVNVSAGGNNAGGANF